MCIRLHVKYPLFLSEFSRQIFFRKNAQISNFVKICPVVAEKFHTERQTYRNTTKLIVSLRNFANASATHKRTVWTERKIC